MSNRSLLLRAAPVLFPAFTATVLSACVDPFALGSSELDGKLLSESPNLAHIAEALGEDLTVQELFDKGEGFEIPAAPDPTALLEATAALDDERPATGGTALKLLSQNVALLDAKVLGFIDYARTPFLDERREKLPERFLSGGHDVLFLQEVWVAEDFERFTKAADEAGYDAFPGMRDGHNDGLLLLVKRDLYAEGSEPETGGAAYQAQDGIEHFPGPGIKRGYQWVRFTHAELGPVVVVNTHMQAFPNKWRHRMQQARELGLVIRDVAQGDALVFVGGDLNAGPYYKEASWSLPGGGVDTTWWKNTISYPMLLEYGELSDLAVMGRPLEDAASDVTLGDTVVNDAAKSTELPGAKDGWCDEIPRTTFTATDCNSLYFAQYAGTEYPARLDHLHVRDPDGRVRVVVSELLFTEKETFGDVETEPSDHFGVSVELVIDGE